jgi:hypothetical protein
MGKNKPRRVLTYSVSHSTAQAQPDMVDDAKRRLYRTLMAAAANKKWELLGPNTIAKIMVAVAKLVAKRAAKKNTQPARDVRTEKTNVRHAELDAIIAEWVKTNPMELYDSEKCAKYLKNNIPLNKSVSTIRQAIRRRKEVQTDSLNL